MRFETQIKFESLALRALKVVADSMGLLPEDVIQISSENDTEDQNTAFVLSLDVMTKGMNTAEQDAFYDGIRVANKGKQCSPFAFYDNPSKSLVEAFCFGHKSQSGEIFTIWQAVNEKHNL